MTPRLSPANQLSLSACGQNLGLGSRDRPREARTPIPFLRRRGLILCVDTLLLAGRIPRGGIDIVLVFGAQATLAWIPPRASRSSRNTIFATIS